MLSTHCCHPEKKTNFETLLTVRAFSARNLRNYVRFKKRNNEQLRVSVAVYFRAKAFHITTSFCENKRVQFYAWRKTCSVQLVILRRSILYTLLALFIDGLISCCVSETVVGEKRNWFFIDGGLIFFRIVESFVAIGKMYIIFK